MNKNKDALAHLIVCKIQNLLPDNCFLCQMTYKINLHETTILDCAVCGQGVHRQCWLDLASVSNDVAVTVDAESFKHIYNPLNLPGFFYICDSCQPNTIPSEDKGNYKRKSQLKVSFEDITYPGSRSSINKAEDTNGSQNLGEIQVDKEETVPSREEYKNPFEAENPEYPIEEKKNSTKRKRRNSTK